MFNVSPLRDHGVVACDFRLEGRATFAGIIFNGSQDRGHIVHVFMQTDRVRIIAHPRKGGKSILIDRKITLPVDQWHPVRIVFKGEAVTVAVGGETVTATHPCLAEQKLSFGLGGDSGGPEGEKAGALEFRSLRFGVIAPADAAASRHATSPPNVLFIIADDQCYSRKKPWCVTAAFIIPHLPFQCDDAWSRPFRDQGLSPDLAECYGSIAQMDACIGRLLDGLRETGHADDTIIVFTSDNGMSSKAEPNREYSEQDWTPRNVHGLRGHKAWVFENGIRVPLLVRWTGTIEPGDRKQFGCAEDILPTVLDLAGIAADTVPHLPFTGVSLRPALETAATIFDRPDAFRMAISGAGSPRDEAGDAIERKYEDHHLVIRGPRFKYHSLPGGRSLLYDIEADPREMTDVTNRHADVAAAMAGACRERWDALITAGRTFPSAGYTRALSSQ